MLFKFEHKVAKSGDIACKGIAYCKYALKFLKTKERKRKKESSSDVLERKCRRAINPGSDFPFKATTFSGPTTNLAF